VKNVTFITVFAVACKCMQPNCEKQHPECTKSHRFELENQKNTGEGDTDPSPLGRGHPSPNPTLLAPSAPRLVSTPSENLLNPALFPILNSGIRYIRRRGCYPHSGLVLILVERCWLHSVSVHHQRGMRCRRGDVLLPAENCNTVAMRAIIKRAEYNVRSRINAI